jgi:hypothetical protein
MFCSHPFTVQQLLKELLRGGNLMRQLKRLVGEGSSDPADASDQIVRYLIFIQDHFKDLVQQDRAQAQSQEQEQGQLEDSHLFYDDTDLIVKYSELMKKLYQDEEWDEGLDRTGCAKCGSFPDKPVITTCLHLWCEECFTQLSISTEGLETEDHGSQGPERAKLLCLKCTLPIDSATRCCFEATKEPEKPVTPAELKAKRQARPKEKGKAKKKGKYSS